MIEGSLEVKLPTIMDRSKSRGGKSQRTEEKKKEDQRRDQRREKSQKREDQDARNR